MTLPTSHLAYQPETDALNSALASPTGVRVRFETYSKASQYRARLHQARSIDKKQNMDIYEPGDELYGRSIFDTLVCRIKRSRTSGAHWVYIEHHVAAGAVEPIVPDDEIEDAQPPAIPTPIPAGPVRRV